eukprot:Nk52_evm34s147 gene=Nk52_evmTU34s147
MARVSEISASTQEESPLEVKKESSQKQHPSGSKSVHDMFNFRKFDMYKTYEGDDEIYPIEDISPEKNEKILKVIRRENEHGEIPTKNHTAHIHYVAKYENGTLIDSSRQRKKRFQLELTDKNVAVIPGLRLGVLSMRVGELAEFTIRPEFGYGESGMHFGDIQVPPNTSMVYEVELFEIELPRDTIPDRIEYAEKKKAEGNTYFQKGLHQEAIVEYLKAVVDLESRIPCGPDAEQRKHIEKLKVQLLTNCAIAMNKIDKYADAAELCERALVLNANWVKARYTLGIAQWKTKKFVDGCANLKHASEMEPQDRSIYAAWKQCKEEKREWEKEREKKKSQRLEAFQ